MIAQQLEIGQGRHRFLSGGISAFWQINKSSYLFRQESIFLIQIENDDARRTENEMSGTISLLPGSTLRPASGQERKDK